MRCLWTDQTYHISPAWWWKRTSGLPFPVKVAYSGVFAFDLQDFWGIFLTCCDHLHHSRCGRHHYRHRTITIKSLFESIKRLSWRLAHDMASFPTTAMIQASWCCGHSSTCTWRLKPMPEHRGNKSLPLSGPAGRAFCQPFWDMVHHNIFIKSFNVRTIKYKIVYPELLTNKLKIYNIYIHSY